MSSNQQQKHSSATNRIAASDTLLIDERIAVRIDYTAYLYSLHDSAADRLWTNLFDALEKAAPFDSWEEA